MYDDIEPMDYPEPLKPVESSDHWRPSHDLARDGYSLPALERILHDVEDQPEWRTTSDLCALYYDSGGVFTREQLQQFQDAGLTPRKINLIFGVINGVLGQEARTRRSPRLEPDDDEWSDVAEVRSQLLATDVRETGADMAISSAYAEQVKCGLGWVEVSDCTDPMQYHRRVRPVHRSEMYWDWRAQQIDLSDARWVLRRQWRDIDDVVAAFPQFREVILHAADGWAGWLMEDAVEQRLINGRSALSEYYHSDRRFRVHRSEWINGGRRRIRMYEVWYRVPAETVTMKVGPRWIQVDTNNPLHVEALRRGMVPVRKAITSQIRRAIFAGPYRLTDEPTRERRFPYVPFFAFRSDADNTPYGLIHGMLAPQDEFNERRMRIQWMLRAQQLEIDSDALDTDYTTIDHVRRESMRPDFMAVTNPNRARAEGIRFRNMFSLQKEQFDMMQDARQSVQDVPRVYSTQLGDAPSGVTSGYAINSLNDMGQMAMGELNDNYGLARRLVFDILDDRNAEDYAQRDLKVTVGQGRAKRVVVLNSFDPETGKIINDMRAAKVSLGLADTPNTPAYMAQASQSMERLVGALGNSPTAALLIPSWIENTSAFGPDRKRLADQVRKVSGIAVDDPQAEDEQRAAQEEQARRVAAMQEQAAQVELEHKASQSELNTARAQLAMAQTDRMLSQAPNQAGAANDAALIAEALDEARRAAL